MMSDLKSLRTMAGLTQYELAQESGIAKWKISLIEALQVGPTPAEENALREALAKNLKQIAAKAARLGHHLSDGSTDNS